MVTRFFLQTQCSVTQILARTKKSSIVKTDLYSSPNIVRVIKSRRMRWAGHEARMGERRVVYGVLVGKP
jgi:hypothetical protein